MTEMILGDFVEWYLDSSAHSLRFSLKCEGNWSNLPRFHLHQPAIGLVVFICSRLSSSFAFINTLLYFPVVLDARR